MDGWIVSGWAFVLFYNPQPKRKGGKKDRQTDRHTHRHEERKKERKKEREKGGKRRDWEALVVTALFLMRISRQFRMPSASE